MINRIRIKELVSSNHMDHIRWVTITSSNHQEVKSQTVNNITSTQTLAKVSEKERPVAFPKAKQSPTFKLASDNQVSNT